MFNSHVLFYSFYTAYFNVPFHCILSLGHPHFRALSQRHCLIDSFIAKRSETDDHLFHLRQCDSQLCAMHVYVAKHEWKTKYVQLLFWLRDTLNIHKTY